MSADLEDLNRDELIELAERQRADINALESRMDALSRQLEKIMTVVAGDRDEFYSLDGYGEGYNIIDRLEQTNASLDGFAERLQQVPTEPADQVDKEGRLWAIRKYLVEQAHAKNQNIYAADYKEIAGLFDGKISDSWASQLMTDAAGTFHKDSEDAKHGFEIVEKKPRNQLRVYVNRIEDWSLLRLKKD